MGSFCKGNDFSSFDEGGEAALTERFGQQVLHDTVGLESLELAHGAMEAGEGAGMVALDAIEFFFGVGIEEGIDHLSALRCAGGHFDLPEFDAMEGPGVAEELVVESLLERAFGTDLRGQAGFERAEVILLAGHDDDVARGEAVLERVHGRDGFAFRSARSGGRIGFVWLVR